MKSGVGPEALSRIALALTDIDPHFQSDAFQTQALVKLDSLELKARVHHIIETLHLFLPRNFEQSAAVLSQIPRVWTKTEGHLQGFAAWPLIDYVAVYGLEYPETSLSLLHRLTPLFSAEFALRPFVLNHPELTLRTLETWLDDPDEHVRRLVSEGTRPRLPWGIQLKPLIADPSPVLPLLDALKDDKSEYVRRSVANHLNDISKDHPERVLDICSSWSKQASKERMGLIRHGTRTLIKQGHPRALALQGVQAVNLEVDFSVSSHLQLGESLALTIKMTSLENKGHKLIVDYALHFLKANGECKPKVFKGKTLHLKAGETTTFSKKHPIKPITTRAYYSGEQAVEVFVNGKSYGKKAFVLAC